MTIDDIKSRPIGFFDSGVGGLTVLKEIKKLMPNENIIYFGDTARLPYGSKDKKTVIKYANQNINFLKSLNVKTIIIACGTVSSLLNEIEKNDFKIENIITPSCKAAVNATKNGKIGVIATRLTVKNTTYTQNIKLINQNMKVFEQACLEFVPIIESEYFYGVNSDKLVLCANEYFTPLKKNGIDTLILGCTHYPLISDLISKTIGNFVNIINPGAAIAVHLKKKFQTENCDNPQKKTGENAFFVSGDPLEFLFKAKIILNCQNLNVNKIDIERF